jgi:hypothetical protein
MTVEAMKQALDALEESGLRWPNIVEAITSLRQAIEQAEKQEPVAWMTINAYGEEDDIHYENPEGHLLEGWTYKPLYTHPQPAAQMRMPKIGDRVICIEDESLATVESLTGGGSPDIKFDDGSHGTYLLREFAELFCYADTIPQPQQAEKQEPIAFVTGTYGGRFTVKPLNPAMVLSLNMALYTTPQPQHEWVGLTEEERTDLRERVQQYTSMDNIKYGLAVQYATEAALREKNGGKA